MLYRFQLFTPVNGQTHVEVNNSAVNGIRVNISGVYGTLSQSGLLFTPGEAMQAFNVAISGEQREDMIVEANAAGRPDTLKDHEFREADIVAHLESDPVAREARVVARRPVVIPDPDPFDEFGPDPVV